MIIAANVRDSAGNFGGLCETKNMDDLGDLLASLAECEKTAETNEALNRVRIYIERKQAHNNVLISLAHEYQYLSNQYRKYLDSLCLMRGTIDMEYMKAWVDVLDTLKCDASATDSVSAVQLRIMNLQKQAFLTQAPLAKSSASSAPSAILESLQIKRCNIKKLRSTLKTTLEQNRASQLEMSERMVGWKSNHAVLDAKRTDYHERIQQATIELDKARDAPDIDYNHILIVIIYN